MHYWYSLAAKLLLLIPSLAGFAVAEAQDVLPPEEAFPYTIEASSDQLLLKFEVQDGYYLYRERFDFASQTAAVTLGAAVLPSGEIHEDEFFGVVETYRGQFEVSIPYWRSTETDELDFQLTAQGCADIGLCYPPQRWTSNVSLPKGSSLFFGTSDSGLLPADEAFVLDGRVDGANQITLSWRIEPGYYLYSEKFAFNTGSEIQLGAARIPAGEPHYDEYFGDVEVFYNYVEAELPFSRASPDAIEVVIDATLQGCKVDSVCYPVIAQSIVLDLPASGTFAAAVDDTVLFVSEQDRLAMLVLNSSWWLVLGTFYGLGLLLAFTPCVLPMVPILSGIIAGQGDNVTAGRGFA
ncbi:MAG: thiol:disulfide interchange protein, partial [Gammaproteobacteria bacterium]